MSALSEDELLESLTWSAQSFILNEFVDEYPLPQVVRVERGHDGGEHSATLGYGEILTLHALKETPMLAGEDRRGNAVAIRLDCPYKVQVLPHDCKFTKCSVDDLPSIYPKVKFLEVVSAHYGTADDAESTGVGERVEIVGIEKRQKKVRVKNPETNQAITFSSNCTAEFRPLLDWRSYTLKELKNHFSFPIRVRFLIDDSNDGATDSDESLGILSKVSDFKVLNEFMEVLVITTTASSCTELKFCYEIPKNLGVKVTVAEGFVCGDRHYQEVVVNLEKGFAVSRFMNTQPLEMCKRLGDIIKAHDYDSHKELFLNVSRGRGSKKATNDDEAPVLPPRQLAAPLCRTVSSPSTPPEIPRKKSMQKARSVDDDGGSSKPVVAPRPKLQSVNDASEQDNAFPPPPPVKQGSFDDSTTPIYTVSGPVLPPKSPASMSKSHQTTPDIPTAECQPKRTKPPPVSQRTSTIIQSKIPSLPPRSSPERTVPDYTEPFTNTPEHPSNDPEQSPCSPPDKTSWRPPKGAQMVFPINFPSNPPVAPRLPTDDDGTDKLEQSDPIPITTNTETNGNESWEAESVEKISTDEVPENTADQINEENNYEELEPTRNQENTKQAVTTVTIPTSSYTADNSKNVYTCVTEGSVGTGWETEDPYAVVARIPADLSGLTVSEVSKLLKNLHMECYVGRFVQEMVDGNLLKTLDEGDLESLGVNAFHSKKLRQFISGWRPKI